MLIRAAASALVYPLTSLTISQASSKRDMRSTFSYNCNSKG